MRRPIHLIRQQCPIKGWRHSEGSEHTAEKSSNRLWKTQQHMEIRDAGSEHQVVTICSRGRAAIYASETWKSAVKVQKKLQGTCSTSGIYERLLESHGKIR